MVDEFGNAPDNDQQGSELDFKLDALNEAGKEYYEKRMREIEQIEKNGNNPSADVPTNEELMGLDAVGDVEIDKGLLHRLDTLGIKPEEVAEELKAYGGKILDTKELAAAARKVAAAYQLKENPIAAAAITGDTDSFMQEYTSIQQGIANMQEWLAKKDDFLHNYHAGTLFNDFIKRAEDGVHRVPTDAEIKAYGELAKTQLAGMTPEKQAAMEKSYRTDLEKQLEQAKQSLKTIAPSISEKAQRAQAEANKKLMAKWQAFVADTEKNSDLLLAQVIPTEFVSDINRDDFKKYVATQLQYDDSGRMNFEKDIEKRLTTLIALEYLVDRKLLKDLPGKVTANVQNRYTSGRNGKK